MAASEEFLKFKVEIKSIKKEKCKDPFESTITGKIESVAVLENSGKVIKGTLKLEHIDPLMFEDLKTHFGGLSDLTPLSLQMRRTPGALISDYDGEGI